MSVQILGPLPLGYCVVVGRRVQFFEEVLVVAWWCLVSLHLLHFGLEYLLGLKEFVPPVTQVLLFVTKALLFAGYLVGGVKQPQP